MYYTQALLYHTHTTFFNGYHASSHSKPSVQVTHGASNIVSQFVFTNCFLSTSLKDSEPNIHQRWYSICNVTRHNILANTNNILMKQQKEMF